MASSSAVPTPERIFSEFNAYHRSAALRAATDLELFTGIGEGADTPRALAKRCSATEKGVRILSDYLVTLGLLSKSGEKYALTAESAAFLDRRSPRYLGSMSKFLMGAHQMQMMQRLTDAVRKGGTASDDHGLVAAENPDWVEFARSMAPLTALPADLLASRLADRKIAPKRVLDVAAGHGLFGIAVARRNPQAEVVGQDWPNVLPVARENASKAGLEGRYRTLPGSAFDVDFGTGYDLVLLTNFLHHFDAPSCTRFLGKVRAALNDGGWAVALEFVPNEDRVSPPVPAQFALIMLAETPGGDAYTPGEYRRMFEAAGFGHLAFEPLPPSPQQLVWAQR